MDSSNSKNKEKSQGPSATSVGRPAAAEEHQKVVTEGQLKWAQFHYRRRAQEVQQKVEELWKTPTTVSDVEGALSDDGNTTEESASSSIQCEAIEERADTKLKDNVPFRIVSVEVPPNLSTKVMPLISRGRRAMLRVSKRAFAKRQEEIRKYGFRTTSDADLVEDSSDDDCDKKDKALAATDEAAWKKARRNRRQSRRRRQRKTKGTDEERLRRFENAFRAMMVTLAASQQPQHPEIAAPSKIWSRPDDAPAFVSIDGRQYDDLKWGVSASREKIGNLITKADFAAMPVDRRASWLVHIPCKERAQLHHFPTNSNGGILIPENVNEKQDERILPVPLGSEKFNDIVGTLQEQATMVRQQLKEQMELTNNYRNASYKRHVDGLFHGKEAQQDDSPGDKDEYSVDNDEEDIDDQHGEYSLDPHSLKSIASQYLTEFVANADEEHVIAALGEKYRGDIESLVEAASDDGQEKESANESNSQVNSKDIVRRYLQSMQQSKPARQDVNDGKNSSKDGAGATQGDEERKSIHREQMASFAGIAARYLAEVSRPHKIERAVKASRHEESLIVSEIKAFLENLNTASDSADPALDRQPPFDTKSLHKFESTIAQYTLANHKGHIGLIQAALQQREGREFVNVVIKYLAGVQMVAAARKKDREQGEDGKGYSGRISNRYTNALVKDRRNGFASNVNQHEVENSSIDDDGEQETLENIAIDFLADCPRDQIDKRDILVELRQERRRGFSKLVSRYMSAVNETIELSQKNQVTVDHTFQIESKSDSSLSPEEVFEKSLHILKRIGAATEQEKANQKTLEAIISRYFASLNKAGEDAIFMELGKRTRKAFSRIVTTYLDDLMDCRNERDSARTKRADVKRNSGRNVSQYLDNVRFIPNLHSTGQVLTEIAVEGIIVHYCTEVYPNLLPEDAAAELRKEERGNFIRLVASYLEDVRECVVGNQRYANAAQNYHPEGGEVSKYLLALRQISNETTSMANEIGALGPALQIEIFSKESVRSSTETRRSPRDSEGVATRYLCHAVDDEDEFFAELRKRESPRFLKEQGGDESPGANETNHGAHHTIQQNRKSIGRVGTPVETGSGSMPAEDEQQKYVERSAFRQNMLSHLAKLRSDCDEHRLLVAMGRLGNLQEDRYQFACGVSRLLNGVNKNTVSADRKNKKDFRAPASRFQAARRGPTNESNDGLQLDHLFESTIVNRTVKVLSDWSGENNENVLLSSLKIAGNNEGVFFSELICGYLEGSVVISDGPNDDWVVKGGGKSEVLAVEAWKARRHPVETPSLESGCPSDLRQQNSVDQPYPLRSINRQNKHSQDNSEKENTFDAATGVTISFLDHHDEEKKTGEGTSHSRSFEPSDFLPYNNQQTESISFESAASVIAPTHSQDLNSPSQSYASSCEFSPERLLDFHHSFMERSKLVGGADAEHTIIDTIGTTSEASDSAPPPRELAGLMLSPTILTKRHRQAVQAIERRAWDQVAYLLSANPWLAEMQEIGTSQYLLHKVAFYGAGSSTHCKASGQLCLDLVKLYPAVQKFDKEGNLPLHMASAARNVEMIGILGERFPSGASVRNEDGNLPLHLVLSSCATEHKSTFALLEVVTAALAFFPGALAVTDNAGNLPLHIATEFLDGYDAVDVINYLVDETDKQLAMSAGLRFRNKITVEDVESVSATCATATAAASDISVEGNEIDEKLPSSMVVNDAGDTPLWVAIRRGAGYEVIEALAVGPGGRRSALKPDTSQNNALHLLVGQSGVDASSIKSILKIAPEAALERNRDRMTPFELACIQGVPSDVVLELLLADLPIYVGDKGRTKSKAGGDSWWFLACEANDRYRAVMEKLICLCTYQQVHELCFMTLTGETLIKCASPECGEFLTVSLLYVGRFEFLASAYANQDGCAIQNDSAARIFEALDYGTEDCPLQEGRRVTLHCYTREEMYAQEIGSLRSLELDFNSVQQISCFVVGERDSYGSGGRQQFCVAIEQPSLTLDRVVAGMLRNDACRENSGLRQKYAVKIFSVLRVVSKALRKLHSLGVVHGNLSPEFCGKFGDRWKLLGTLRLQRIGDTIDYSSFGQAAPPEALDPQNSTSAHALDRQAASRINANVDPSIDIWCFGKLAYDVLVGEPLVPFDSRKETRQYHNGLNFLRILHLSPLDLVEARRCLRGVGVPLSGVDLITSCLSQEPESRPSSMTEIVRSDIWEGLMGAGPITRKEVARLHEC